MIVLVINTDRESIGVIDAISVTMVEPKNSHNTSAKPWIDSHHHLWRYVPSEYPWMSEEMTGLKRDFYIQDLVNSLGGRELVGTVAVQARQSVQETEWLIEQAAQSQLIKGVVGWAPLVDANVGEWLERWQGAKALKGLRHVLHDEEDDHYMLRNDFNDGIRLLRQNQLTYDLLIFERHLPQTVQFVDKHPNQVFVLDHIAKPRIKEDRLEPWKSNLQLLAQRQNVYCKLSGMVTEAAWSTWSNKQLWPYVEHVIDIFGPSRLMFGSDWPVVTVASSYGRWMDTVEEWLGQLTESEASAIRHDTAAQVYRLSV